MQLAVDALGSVDARKQHDARALRGLEEGKQVAAKPLAAMLCAVVRVRVIRDESNNTPHPQTPIFLMQIAVLRDTWHACSTGARCCRRNSVRSAVA
jgi:hypothetical protein